MTFTTPAFFIVGAPKCGTTAMCDFLSQHPSIYIPKIKEPHFFGKDLTGARHTRSLDDYLDLFPENDEILCGEGSTWYLFSKYAAEEIYDFNPKARIIIMLREPVDLLYSLHNQMLFDGRNENIASFQEAVLAEPLRRSGKKIPRSCLRKEALFYSEIPLFSEQLRRYYNVFGAERIMVILHEDFESQPFEVYAKVLKFLGLDHGFLPEIRRVNGSKFVKNKWVNSLKNSGFAKRMAKTIIPPKLLETAKEAIYTQNTVYREREELDPLFASQLQKKFLPEIDYISELLDRDLSHWIKN